MGLLRRIFGRTPGDANAALARALSTAESVKSMDDIADDWSKQQEIVGVIQNLKAASSALSSGKDDEGRRITPADIGAGLQAMLTYMKDNAIWFRLHANASRSARGALDKLEGDVADAARALRAR